MIEWLKYFGDVVWQLITIMCLFEGARRLAYSGASRTAIFTLAFGVVLCIANGGAAFWKYNFATASMKFLNRHSITARLPLPDKWQPCCNSDRGLASRAIVRSAYFESGVLQTYFDASGNRKLFTPTQDDIRDREWTVAMQTQIRDSAWARKLEAVYWLIAGLIVPLFGAGWGRESRRPDNPLVELNKR